MRVVVAGTPEVAVPTLDALMASEHEVVAVLTRPDAPLGRKRIMTPSPLAARAEALGVPILKSAKPDEEVIRQLRELGVELGVVVAYGALLTQPVLDAIPHGWVNLHFSALPKWRGAAPLQRAVMAGERTSALTVFQLEAGLDTGPIFKSTPADLDPTKTSGELLADFAVTGADLVVDVVDGIASAALVSVPQVGEPTHAAKLTRDDGHIDWHREAWLVSSHIRGVTPEPGARALIGEDWLKIHEIADAADAGIELAPGELGIVAKRLFVGTATTPIELLRVQPAGKQAMTAMDWWRGMSTRLAEGDRVTLA